MKTVTYHKPTKMYIVVVGKAPHRINTQQFARRKSARKAARRK